MNDAYYLMETFLICAAPFGMMAAGLQLRRWFPGGAGRLCANLAIWSGEAALLLGVLFAFNFAGKL